MQITLLEIKGDVSRQNLRFCTFSLHCLCYGRVTKKIRNEGLKRTFSLLPCNWRTVPCYHTCKIIKVQCKIVYIESLSPMHYSTRKAVLNPCSSGKSMKARSDVDGEGVDELSLAKLKSHRIQSELLLVKDLLTAVCLP